MNVTRNQRLLSRGDRTMVSEFSKQSSTMRQLYSTTFCSSLGHVLHADITKSQRRLVRLLYTAFEMWWHTRRNQIFVFRRNGRVHLNRLGASVQSTTGSRGVRVSGSNAGYTMFRGSVKGTGYPLHSPVSLSLPLPCVIVCQHISAGLCYLCRPSLSTLVLSALHVPALRTTTRRQPEWRSIIATNWIMLQMKRSDNNTFVTSLD